MDDHQYLSDELTFLKVEMKELKDDVKKLTSAFEAASALVSVIKWIAGVATGITAFYLLITGHYK